MDKKFILSLTDNASGNDWSKTYFICNGKVVPYQRMGTSNSFEIVIALLHATPIQNPSVFDNQILTSDLTGNKQYFAKFYPCKRAIKFLTNLEGIASNPAIRHQALVNIEVSGSVAAKPRLELKAGKVLCLTQALLQNHLQENILKQKLAAVIKIKKLLKFLFYSYCW
ncbi:hypothetical protein H1R81_08785 [Emticicia sp. BO119]|nr:hypothetical protein [Emticicia sp. BO119]MBA4850486.1 hypothetical protein [Emticicia sp. BO119]